MLASRGCSSGALKRALRSLHSRIGARLQRPRDVLRDLGVDNTAGRLRRLGTFKKRMAKALKRAGKLRQLTRGVRTTLVQTNVLASGLWGVQGNGIAPCVEEFPKPGGVQGCPPTLAWLWAYGVATCG